jgi:hypothetical protein
MADVVQDTHQEFWRSPTVLDPSQAALPAVGFPSADFPPADVHSAAQEMAEACADCGTEFMIGARFCHACGRRRPALTAPGVDASLFAGLWSRSIPWLRSASASVAAAWRRLSFPAWVHYLHFHEIKRWIGLPTAPLIAFMIGLGCVAGAIGVSLFYHASTLAEFQAIQMWRVEWLLAATASFVAGILLKKSSDTDND